MEQRFMQMAIDLAWDNVSSGVGGPYGAVVVRNGEVVATGTNRVLTDNDPTAHAELVAVRAAAQKLGRTDLSDCEIYASSEPCPMCLAAIYWSRIKAVYYCYPKDPIGPELNAAFIYDQLSRPMAERAVPMRQMANAEPDKNPLALWRQRLASA
ncbi:MAG TPA: nucleoside deaminase [Limnochordales bacterium]